MIPANSRSALAIGLSLALLMAVTRSHPLATLLHLPDASWAVFFLAGAYLRPLWVFPALSALAGVSDYVAIGWLGVSDFCVSPAYGLLLPAYGTLWFAGRWYAGRHRYTLSTLVPLAGSVIIGAMVCEVLSGGGFYLFSGRFEPSLAQFGNRLARYFPMSLASMVFYTVMASIVHMTFATLYSDSRQRGEPRALHGR